MTRIYSFDATASTHDDLKQGITELKLAGSQHRHHRIVIEAETHTEAFLTAAAMVLGRGLYLTGLYDRI